MTTLLAALLLVPLFGALGGFLWLRGSLPQTEGEIVLPGLAAPVTLLRDDDGLLTIQAESERDAAFALGFAHAQDRLWQMDFTRRTGLGRLAEVAGEAVVPTDRFLRMLGIARLAEAAYAQLSAEARALVDSYSAGINAFHEQRSGPLPLEFQVLRHEPAYVGLVASRKRSALLFERLHEDGFDLELLRRVSAPAGLDPGAETPEEIALSIVAELSQRRRGERATGRPLSELKGVRMDDGRVEVPEGPLGSAKCPS